MNTYILISEIEFKKFRNYLWYLSSENSTLTFFNDKILLETKNLTIQALCNKNDKNNIKKNQSIKKL